MKSLFGDQIADVPTRARKTGHAAKPGTGPAGQTCGTCRHRCRVEGSKTTYYQKCGLMRRHWTAGAGSDIRAGDPACSWWDRIGKT